MKINTNVSAIRANSSMAKNSALAGSSMEKLSTGLAINKAGDNAAGLAISEKMRAQIRGMEQGERNIQDGISLVQVAEGALSEAGEIVQRMRELGVQGGNSTLNDADRDNIAVELDQLAEELAKMAEETTFNGQKLFGKDSSFTIQVGANSEVREVTGINLNKIIAGEIDTKIDDGTGNATIKSTLLGGTASYKDADGSIADIDGAGVNVGTVKDAQVFTAVATNVLEQITTARAKLGAQQNRLEATASNLGTSIENLTSAESRIRDTDVAKEIVKLSKLNLLTQTSQSMVAQAKSQPESIVSLLR